MIFDNSSKKISCAVAGVGTVFSSFVPCAVSSAVHFSDLGNICLDDSPKNQIATSLMQKVFGNSKTFWFCFRIKGYGVGRKALFYVSISKESPLIMYYDENSAKNMKDKDEGGVDAIPAVVSENDGFYNMNTKESKMPKHIKDGGFFNDEIFKKLNMKLEKIYKDAQQNYEFYEGEAVPAVQ